MILDRENRFFFKEKGGHFVTSGIAIGMGLILACVPQPGLPEQQLPVTEVSRPQICQQSPELFRPPTLSKESVATYSHGAIVNRAGRAIDLTVNIPQLLAINTNPDFGLSFTDNTTNITYFFAESFQDPKDKQQALNLVQQDLSFVSYLYCHEQKKSSGVMRFSVISVADELMHIIENNPRKYPINHPIWKAFLSVQLSIAYLDRSQRDITDLFDTLTSAATSQKTRSLIAGNTLLPFMVNDLHPEYLKQYLPKQAPPGSL